MAKKLLSVINSKKKSQSKRFGSVSSTSYWMSLFDKPVFGMAVASENNTTKLFR
jgi:hypothetical protein